MAKVCIKTRGRYFEYSFEAKTQDGKRKRITKSGFSTKKEALAAGTKALAEYNQGAYIPETEMTVKQFVDTFIQYCKQHKMYGTTYNYGLILNAYVVETIGDYKLKNVRLSTAQAIIAEMKKRDLCQKTMCKIVDVIRNAFDYAVKCDYISKNPFAFLEAPKTNKKGNPHKAYTAEEMQEILDAYKDDIVMYPVIMIGYHCGLRISEICALTWNDIDFENKTISINKKIINRRIGLYFEIPKCNTTGIIAIDDTLLTFLMDFKNKITRKTYSVNSDGKLIDGNDFSFIVTTKWGTATTSNRIAARISFLKNKGYPELKTHDFRHTHCTDLINNNFSVAYVQTRLRHKSSTTTLSIYNHLTSEKESLENAKLNGLFS